MKRAEGRGVICAVKAMPFDAVVPRRRAAAPPLQPHHHVCACVRERENERERERVRESERERERESVCVRMCVCTGELGLHSCPDSVSRQIASPAHHLSKDADARDNIPLDPDARPRFCDKGKCNDSSKHFHFEHFFFAEFVRS
jgi:hypothetical protein